MADDTLVYVEWVDSCSLDRWETQDEVSNVEPLSVQTVGWLVSETKSTLRVSGSRNSHQFCCTMIIPKRCILARLDRKWPKLKPVRKKV